MLSTQKIRFWRAIHTWTSLICTLFLLMLALTGLPLIFHDEIDEWFGKLQLSAETSSASSADFDAIVREAQAVYPKLAVRYLIWDKDLPGVVKVNMAASIDAPRGKATFLSLEEATSRVLDPQPGRSSAMTFILQLHTDMFAGDVGSVFLGLMGALFVISLVSGVVLYAPFMRKLHFGTVRAERGRAIKWLDLHNLLGITTTAWLLVVGLTGVINTLDSFIFRYWRSDQLAQMVAPYKAMPPPARIGSVTEAISKAKEVSPDRTPSFLAFPGTFFSSKHHYAVFMRGKTPLTSQILEPVLVDAETLRVTEKRTLPWYVLALELSRPLHFGDYGEMPLKVIWAALDAVAIVVIASGLYLWVKKRMRPTKNA
ncbi:PepSY-associated TM helix domain-containing protein [Bradyrhizobium sp.]|uniref:PepSY-associated TM helix domain-containing protein n=1 Tax=Bradyrhizobium sp. TaxID=376 RepID=UPI0039E5EDF2